MRIAHFSDAFLPKIDGVVVSLLTLSSELGRRGHRLSIFCPSPERGKRIVWSAPNVEIHPAASVRTFYPDLRVGAPNPRTLLKLRGFRADVVHLQSPGPLGMEGLVGSGLLRLPIVHTFHTYFMEPEYLKLVRLSRFRRVSEALWRYVMAFCKRCDFIVAPTEFVARDLQERGLEKPLRVVPNGVDLALVNGVRPVTVRAAKEELGLGEHVVLYVGRLSKEKNLETMLRAFARVRRRFEEAQLLIVGGGPERNRLSLLAERLGVRDRVIFAGEIVHARLLSSGIFQAARVFCTPSTSETQGLSVVEAIAAGLPVVGAAARGVKELVDGNGVLVEGDDVDGFSEGILSFLGSDERRQRAAKQSRKRAQSFSIEKVADKMERIYSSLMS